MEFVKGEDPRKRFKVGVDFLQDVTDTHGGYVVGGTMRGWYPLARATVIGLAIGATYASEDYMTTYFDVLPGASAASGLPVYRTGAGMRDVRATLVVVQSFSRSWHVGAGLLYSHLLSGAADSPVVQRGSSEQLIGGVGVAYAW